MHGVNRPPFVDARPFGLPVGSVEITLDLPMPPSTNRLWRSATIRATRKTRYYKSPEYLGWCEQADITVMAAKQYPKRKILGPFEFQIMLSTAGRAGRDGDNFCKAALDWLQSRDIIRNDSDCRRGSWAWVEPAAAPKGCRVILRSLHGQCE